MPPEQTQAPEMQQPEANQDEMIVQFLKEIDERLAKLESIVLKDETDEEVPPDGEMKT